MKASFWSSPRVAHPASSINVIKYTAKVTKIEAKVPTGKDCDGFLRSPDILAPAMTPVTAGKNTAKANQKFMLL